MPGNPCVNGGNLSTDGGNENICNGWYIDDSK